MATITKPAQIIISPAENGHIVRVIIPTGTYSADGQPIVETQQHVFNDKKKMIDFLEEKA